MRFLSTTEAVGAEIVGGFVLRSWIVWRFGEKNSQPAHDNSRGRVFSVEETMASLLAAVELGYKSPKRF